MDICDNNKSERGEIMPCKALQKMFDEQQKIGMAKGLEQGVQQGKTSGIQNMLDLGLTKEQILTKYTTEEFAMAEKAMAVK